MSLKETIVRLIRGGSVKLEHDDLISRIEVEYRRLYPFLILPTRICRSDYLRIHPEIRKAVARELGVDRYQVFDRRFMKKNGFELRSTWLITKTKSNRWVILVYALGPFPLGEVG